MRIYEVLTRVNYNRITITEVFEDKDEACMKDRTNRLYYDLINDYFEKNKIDIRITSTVIEKIYEESNNE